MASCHTALYTLPEEPAMRPGPLPADQPVVTVEGEVVTVESGRVLRERDRSEWDQVLPPQTHGERMRVRTRRDRVGTAGWSMAAISVGSTVAFFTYGVVVETSRPEGGFGWGFPVVPATLIWTSMLSGLGAVVSGATWVFIDDGVRPAEVEPLR